MSLILNILWFIFGGFFAGLAWLLAGILMVITIVGIPWARAAFTIASFSGETAAAGLFSSWVNPADSEPRASRRSRCPTVCAELRLPKKMPSSRCTAIGKFSRMNAAKSSALSAKNVDGT